MNQTPFKNRVRRGSKEELAPPLILWYVVHPGFGVADLLFPCQQLAWRTLRTLSTFSFSAWSGAEET